jgi:homoaconitase/3-isopropylmalate dehydratase large subunit
MADAGLRGRSWAGRGYACEYAGDTMARMSMHERMTIVEVV